MRTIVNDPTDTFWSKTIKLHIQSFLKDYENHIIYYSLGIDIIPQGLLLFPMQYTPGFLIHERHALVLNTWDFKYMVWACPNWALDF